MRRFITSLACSLTVAACAASHAAPAHRDAGPPETLVTVELTRGIGPSVGETVVFQDAAGEPLFETTTDERGVATYAPGAATVTVTLVMRRPSGHVDISSREGLVAGDVLRLPLRPDAHVEPGFEVRFPGTFPGAVRYDAVSAYLNFGDANADASPVQAPYCDGPFQHVVARALGADYRPIAFSAARDLPARVRSVLLPPWSTEFPRPPAIVTSVPDITDLKAGVGEPSRGWIGDYPVTGTDVYSVFVSGVTTGGDGVPVTHRVETRAHSMPSEVTLRADDVRPAPANVRVTSREGRPTFAWDGPLPPRTSHITLVVDYMMGAVQCVWLFRVAPRSDGVVRFPRLPSRALPMAPPERDVRWQAWMHEEDWHDGYQWISDAAQPMDGTVRLTSVSGAF